MKPNRRSRPRRSIAGILLAVSFLAVIGTGCGEGTDKESSRDDPTTNVSSRKLTELQASQIAQIYADALYVGPAEISCNTTGFSQEADRWIVTCFNATEQEQSEYRVEDEDWDGSEGSHPGVEPCGGIYSC